MEKICLTDPQTPRESLRQAVEDSRRRENLIGPFATAEEAVISMLKESPEGSRQNG